MKTKDFEILDLIPTKTFAINGIVYNKDNVYKKRFTRVIEDCASYGKLHVTWDVPQKAFIDDHGHSVNPVREIKAREALCSGFFFDENDIEYIKD